ncbi:MAG TPA: host-nuclease inhibitor Gam family protein [Phycisphaerae bacterium]|nr:host-nuclease inhibitor Gam family protein [Phycisphaerae bacterium]
MTTLAEQTADVDEESFGFADEDLAGLCDRLGEEGVDIPALLTELAAMDPDRQMRRYRAMAIRKAMIEAQVEREKLRLELWRHKQIVALDRDMVFLGQGLTNAARSLAERTKGKIKKLDTPWGYVQLRKLPPSLRVEDVDAALAALDELIVRGVCIEGFIRIKREVNASLLKKAMLDGEIESIPGVRLEQPEEDSVTIKPALPDLERKGDDGSD